MKKRQVLTDPEIKRQTILRLPQLDYHVESDPERVLKEDDAKEFCLLYEKIRTRSAIFEGMIRIDFDASSIKRGRWSYEGITPKHPKADRLEPLCLVVLQSVGTWTYCRMETRPGRNQKTLVVTNPHIVIYAKAAPSREPGGPLPIPILPDAAMRGYAAVYERDISELCIAPNGAVRITER